MMTNLLLKFRCEQAALKALVEEERLELGVVTFEPLQIRAYLAVSGSTLLFSAAVSVPDLAPHGMLQVSGEVGVLDTADAIWHVRAAEMVFRHPGGMFWRLPLGALRDVLKYARADGGVWFGVLVNDLVLLPDARRPDGKGPDVVRRAYQRADFVVRRLQAENRRLAAQLVELEATLNLVLTSPPGRTGDEPPAPVTAGPAAPADPTGPTTPPRPGLRELGAVAGAVKALVERADPVELRALQSVLGEFQAATTSALTEAEACVICLERPATEFFIPCNHRCCCAACADRMTAPNRLCPLCRAAIARRTKTPPAPPPPPKDAPPRDTDAM